MYPPDVYGRQEPGRAWRSYLQGMDEMKAGRYTQALAKFTLAVSYMPENAVYQRKLGEVLERLERFEEAADAYEREAAIRTKAGDVQAALVQEQRARSLRSELKVFVQAAQRRAPAAGRGLALYEPPAGLYFGAYVEEDRGVGQNNPGRFNTIIGRQHAIFFRYHRYGQPFPRNWARLAREAGAAIHLAMEPKDGLRLVQDNDYLRQFAREARAAQIPIFLRFASEMNGAWVPWHGNPQLYIERWRVVARVMREEAPNVAMVWTPNSVPVVNINDYYPGDDYVDWVGVNLYSVAYFDGDPRRPADNVNPLDLIKPIYEMYAERKPIQVSEFGATHFTAATGEDTTEFAITKMRQLYHGVQMLYPRVKNINWFSMNTITDASRPERRLNNFSLTENTRLQAAYREMLGYPYFLTQVVNGPHAAEAGKVTVPVPLADAGTLAGEITLQCWARTYDPYISRVEYTLNGKHFATETSMPYAITIDTAELTDGEQFLSVTAYDSRGRSAVTRTVSFRTSGGKKRREHTIVLTLGRNQAVVDGRTATLESPPRLVNGETLVPLRFVSQKMGAEVLWEAGRTTIRRGGQTIVLNAGESTVLVNGERRPLRQPPLTERRTTFVPLRFIAENFDANVQFKDGIVTIRIPVHN